MSRDKLRTDVPASVPPALPDLDSLWDFDDPAGSESRFRRYLPQAEASGDGSASLQCLTQIARALGLQRRFEEAHAVLDEVDMRLSAAPPIVRMRALLERGRALNSLHRPEDARPLFVAAWELARAEHEDGLAVDAAHMVAIADAEPEGRMEWNLRALALAESSPQPRARKWLGSLCNNIGWTHHDAGRFPEALDMFEKALRFREDSGAGAAEVRVARWCVARALRSLGRDLEALERQLELQAELTSAGRTDGYVLEELAECLRSLGRPEEARPYFARAFEELARDAWFADSQPARLDRLRRLGLPGPAAETDPA